MGTLAAKRHSRAFTIVELLIVVVVIAILAAITTVSYVGITQRAKESSARSALSQGASQLEVDANANAGYYPVDIASTSLGDIEDLGDVTYQYSPTADGRSYCLTAMVGGEISYSVEREGSMVYGPCEGHKGGTGYCPSDTYVPIDGYYCEGAVGQVTNGITKLLSTDSGVPANAPATFVGRQTNRDSYAGNAFTVTAGQVYCVSGWAASTTSTVGHTFGFQFTGSGMSTTWHNVGYVVADGQWHEITGCRTVPAGYTSARFWTQNNGTNGTTAADPWYQTKLDLQAQ